MYFSRRYLIEKNHFIESMSVEESRYVESASGKMRTWKYKFTTCGRLRRVDARAWPEPDALPSDWSGHITWPEHCPLIGQLQDSGSSQVWAWSGVSWPGMRASHIPWAHRSAHAARLAWATALGAGCRLCQEAPHEDDGARPKPGQVSVMRKVILLLRAWLERPGPLCGCSGPGAPWGHPYRRR